MDPADPTPSEKLKMALDMHDFGVEIMHQNLVRAHPLADDAEIERLLIRWLHHRPGAEDGDAEGVRSDRFV